MKRRHWLKTMGAAVAGLTVLTRVRAGAGDGSEARRTENEKGLAPAKAREARRYVMGFETELMR